MPIQPSISSELRWLPTTASWLPSNKESSSKCFRTDPGEFVFSSIQSTVPKPFLSDWLAEQLPFTNGTFARAGAELRIAGGCDWEILTKPIKLLTLRAIPQGIIRLMNHLPPTHRDSARETCSKRETKEEPCGKLCRLYITTYDSLKSKADTLCATYLLLLK